MVRIERVYEVRSDADRGEYRVLVDRLWPRGLKKEAVHADAWLKGLAPSDDLRKWFQHDPDRFPEFRKRYERELRAEPARTWVDDLARRAAHETVTLLFAARDKEHNNAVVLAHEIERVRKRMEEKPG